MIISALRSYLQDKSVSLQNIVDFYPNIAYNDDHGERKVEIFNRYFLMLQEELPNEETRRQFMWVLIVCGLYIIFFLFNNLKHFWMSEPFFVVQGRSEVEALGWRDISTHVVAKCVQNYRRSITGLQLVFWSECDWEILLVSSLRYRTRSLFWMKYIYY